MAAFGLVAKSLKAKAVCFLLPLLGPVIQAADGASSVANAVDNAIAQFVSAVSGHDVPFALEVAIESFTNSKWKVKVAAISLVKKIAERPGLETALSDCLSFLAEPIIEATQDTHPKVHAVAIPTMDLVCPPSWCPACLCSIACIYNRQGMPIRSGSTLRALCR
eukprot:SAG31_NODE_8758_length_1393_cov_1.262751_1_plen_164_part_00